MLSNKLLMPKSFDMRTHIHLINNQKVCDVDVQIVVDLPAKPCVDDYIRLTTEQAIELTELALEHNYNSYPELKSGNRISRLNIVLSVLFNLKNDTLHLEIMPYDKITNKQNEY